MRLNKHLVREILLSVEKHPSGLIRPDKANFPGFDQGQVRYHFSLVLESPYARGHILPDADGETFCFELTFAGHQFLSLARDKQRWTESVNYLDKELSSYSFELLVDFLKRQERQNQTDKEFEQLEHQWVKTAYKAEDENDK